jgi:hypothetical protein
MISCEVTLYRETVEKFHLRRTKNAVFTQILHVFHCSFTCWSLRKMDCEVGAYKKLEQRACSGSRRYLSGRAIQLLLAALRVAHRIDRIQ